MFRLRYTESEPLGDKARESVFAKRFQITQSILMLEPLEYNMEEVPKGSGQSCVFCGLSFYIRHYVSPD